MANINNTDMVYSRRISEQQLILKAKMIRLENEDKKEDSQRIMIWFALAGMLIYPFLVVICEFANMPNAAKLLEDMSNVYFVSISGLVAVYFGSNAYSKSKTIDSIDSFDSDSAFEHSQSNPENYNFSSEQKF